MSRLFLATISEEWESRVRKAFEGQLNGELRAWDEESLRQGDRASAIKEITDHDPMVVAFGPDLPLDFSLSVAAELDRDRPEVCTVLVADPTPELWQRAMRSGVRDVMAPDAQLSDMRAVLERALDTAVRRRGGFQAPEKPGTQTARIIAVVSPKGGAGKTAIATNLAVGLARVAAGETLIVDLDLQFGDVANALRLAPEQTIADTVHAASALDTTSIKAFLTGHPCELFALCAPDSPAEADEITPAHVLSLLDLLAGEFRYIIIDTAAGLDEHTLTAMERATDLIVVCGTDVASARSVRKELEAFDLLGLTTQRRHFVLNRADARVGLGVSDIEATVGMEVGVAIPSSRAVPLSMNQGIPLLEDQQKSPVSRSLGELVHRIAGTAPTTPDTPAPGLLRRWKEPR